MTDNRLTVSTWQQPEKSLIIPQYVPFQNFIRVMDLGATLLITDGNNNYGAQLGDVALYARRLNTSINVINVEAIEDDSSVIIYGPAKVTADVESTYTVVVDGEAIAVTMWLSLAYQYIDNTDKNGIVTTSGNFTQSTLPVLEHLSNGAIATVIT